VPAAYLLVVVDLLISHWPKSAKLRCLISGVLTSCLTTETVCNSMYGGAGLACSLQSAPQAKGAYRTGQRRRAGGTSVPPSGVGSVARHHANYLEPLANGEQQQLQSLLETSASQLGEPDSKSNLLDPSEMVRYSLNRLNHANWKPAEIEQADGQAKNELVYEPPPEEAKHFAQLLREANPLHVDASMVKILGQLLSLPGVRHLSSSSPRWSGLRRRLQSRPPG